MQRMDADERTPWKKRSGRRAGPTTSNVAILQTARVEFGDHGFAGVTTRGIAKAAGVDVALVHHFFLTKQGVFAAAVQDAFAVSDLVPIAVQGAPERTGERVVRAFVSHWEQPEIRPAITAVLRSVTASEGAKAAVRGFLGETVLRPVTVALGRGRPELRASLAGTALIGLAHLRYVLGSPEVAAMRPEQLVFSVADVCQGYLFGRL